MFKRQTTGSVVCASCGSLVGVNDETVLHLRPPESWFVGLCTPPSRLGNDLGFVPLIIYGCAALYSLGLLLTPGVRRRLMGGGNPLGILSAHPTSI